MYICEYISACKQLKVFYCLSFPFLLFCVLCSHIYIYICVCVCVCVCWDRFVIQHSNKRSNAANRIRMQWHTQIAELFHKRLRYVFPYLLRERLDEADDTPVFPGTSAPVCLSPSVSLFSFFFSLSLTFSLYPFLCVFVCLCF